MNFNGHRYIHIPDRTDSNRVRHERDHIINSIICPRMGQVTHVYIVILQGELIIISKDLEFVSLHVVPLRPVNWSFATSVKHAQTAETGQMMEVYVLRVRYHVHGL